MNCEDSDERRDRPRPFSFVRDSETGCRRVSDARAHIAGAGRRWSRRHSADTADTETSGNWYVRRATAGHERAISGLLASFPALPGRANVWRAYGAVRRLTRFYRRAGGFRGAHCAPRAMAGKVADRSEFGKTVRGGARRADTDTSGTFGFLIDTQAIRNGL
jgi:hypothetical protein